MRPQYLFRLKERRKKEWEFEYAAAKAQLEAAGYEAPKGAAEKAKETIRCVVRLVAVGKTIKQAAGELQYDLKAVYNLKRSHKKKWAEESAIAEAQLGAIGIRAPKGPQPATVEQIRRATALAAAGLDWREISAEMKVKIGTLQWWRREHATLWEQEILASDASGRPVGAVPSGDERRVRKSGRLHSPRPDR